MKLRLRSAFAWCTLGACFTTFAFAQTGPLEPRMVYVAMPTPLPSSKNVDVQAVSLELSVGSDGVVQTVSALNSSGDPRFDEKLRKYYSKVRMIPALTEQGVPIESRYRFVFRQAGATPLSQASYVPGGTPTQVSASAPSKDRLFDEVGRINRMRCKDFLWEYDLMKDIAGAKAVYDERILRTAQAMFVVQDKVAGDALQELRIRFSESVRAAVDDCRKRPDEKFFEGVLTPVLREKLAH
jgi:TonB family protein